MELIKSVIELICHVQERRIEALSIFYDIICLKSLVGAIDLIPINTHSSGGCTCLSNKPPAIKMQCTTTPKCDQLFSCPFHGSRTFLCIIVPPDPLMAPAR